ncbi:hypothetical protein B566_EDAN018004 [Ephemera danica]|nr:hypothetical protein B566_EDAN018004 [Ephemera danica]
MLAHEGHQGIVKTKQRLRSKVWWFTMDKDVEEFYKHCHGCQIVAPFELSEPQQPTALPTGSWKDIAIDYLGPFANGKNILVVIDYYSRFIEAVITTSTTAATTINILEEILCRFGYPESMSADQAPQLSGSEMRDYCLITAKDGNAITVRAPSGTEYRRNSTWAKPYQPPLPETKTELSTLEEKQQDNSRPVVS